MEAVLAQYSEPIGAAIGFILTLCVFSYLIGDNFLFRAASAIFVGISAGFVTVLILYNVVWQRLALPMLQTGNVVVIAVLALAFGIWVLVARSTPLGRPVIGFLTGVGAATALGGAIFGTLLPQVEAASNAVAANLLSGSVALVGTITTLVYFNFRGKQISEQSAQREKWVEFVGWIGQFFISITFGVLYAGVLIAALTALSDRLWVLWQFIGQYILPLFPLQ